MVLVGNGPSAPQYANEIDACDIVARINAFPIGEAGKKWDAWYSAFCGFGGEHAKKIGMYVHPSRPSWVWMPVTVPVSNCPFKPTRITLIQRQRIGEIALLTNRLSKVTRGHHPVTGKVRPIQPTAGMLAIDIALSLKPKMLVIVGFDAKSKNSPGWRHYGSTPAPWSPEKPSPSGGKHDYELQTRMQEEWVFTRKFYGRYYPDTEPIWWRLK
jgi:hypothetical protein